MEPKMRIDNLLNGGALEVGDTTATDISQESPPLYSPASSSNHNHYYQVDTIHHYGHSRCTGIEHHNPHHQNHKSIPRSSGHSLDEGYRDFNGERRGGGRGALGDHEGYEYSISSSRGHSARHHHHHHHHHHREPTSSSSRGYVRSSSNGNNNSPNHYPIHHPATTSSSSVSAYYTAAAVDDAPVHQPAEYQTVPGPPHQHHDYVVDEHASSPSSKGQVQRGDRDVYQHHSKNPQHHYTQHQHSPHHHPSLLPPFNDFVSGPGAPAIYPPLTETRPTVTSPPTCSMTSSSTTYYPRTTYTHQTVSPYPLYYPTQYADDAASTGEGANALMTFANYVASAAISDSSYHPPPSRRDSRLIDPLLRSPTTPDKPLFHPPTVHSPTTPSPSPSPRSTSSTTTTNSLLSPPNSATLSVCCSYTHVCTTGSPLRKVVSHIFGRNKLSTRQIPKHVWVYYCRKHYQRSRYRNPKGFARQQVVLVRKQCQRLEEWGGVRDWVIKVRRREELRLARDGSHPDVITSGVGGGGGWIQEFVGRGKTIKEIYNLLDKIEIEVQQNGGKFPDVELLPSVDLELAGEEVDGGAGGDGATEGRVVRKRVRVGEQAPEGAGKRLRGLGGAERVGGHGIGTRGSARLMMAPGPARGTPPSS